MVRLLDLIVEKPNITRKELAEALKINPSAVLKAYRKTKRKVSFHVKALTKKDFGK